jgi:glucuronide carrier protein
LYDEASTRVLGLPLQLVEGDVMLDHTVHESVAHSPVVTIFEQYGAGAHQVGERVATALEVPFHPQAFSSEEIEGGQEAATEEAALLARVFSVLGGAYGGFEGRDVAMTQQDRYELIMDNNRQVWEHAHDGGVILGRNATVILAERPNTLHLLLTGSVEDRIARAVEEFGISRERAAARQKREDEVRADMSLSLYGWDPRLPDRYDMVINTSRISLDAAVDAVVALVRASAA